MLASPILGECWALAFFEAYGWANHHFPYSSCTFGVAFFFLGKPLYHACEPPLAICNICNSFRRRHLAFEGWLSMHQDGTGKLTQTDQDALIQTACTSKLRTFCRNHHITQNPSICRRCSKSSKAFGQAPPMACLGVFFPLQTGNGFVWKWDLPINGHLNAEHGNKPLETW